ncbi:hypothetical protein [Citrobacter murliniae]|uniref:hypothetical protein n=1 Tax=Citrobacter TaxID=544 RepID=UPI000AE6C02F|nr:hypothetical protein [Citrobacter murliniae]
MLFKQKMQEVRCGLVRLKIADAFPKGRESQHGCWLRARFAGTLPRARPGSLEELAEGIAKQQFSCREPGL